MLAAALGTRLYRPALESAGLGSLGAIADLESIEASLARMPRSELAARQVASGFLVTREAPARNPGTLFWPLPPGRRTAVLLRGFPHWARMRVFSSAGSFLASSWRADALAGPVSELHRAADLLEDRWHSMSPLTHSVIAFVFPGSAFLSGEARDRLWRVFRVPVFGQIFGPSGELLAWECESHESYHIEEDRAVIEVDRESGEPELLVTSLTGFRRIAIRLAIGLAGSIEQTTCGCGRPGRRLVDVRRALRATPRAPAHSACAVGAKSCAAGAGC